MPGLVWPGLGSGLGKKETDVFSCSKRPRAKEGYGGPGKDKPKTIPHDFLQGAKLRENQEVVIFSIGRNIWAT